MRARARGLALATGPLFAAAALLAAGLLAGVPARAAPVAHRAHDARALSVNDTGHLHLRKAYGSVLQEEGYASGTLPGRAQVRLVVGSSVSATFSIRTSRGTIYGRGKASLHSSGRYASFGGTLSVSHGSGRYAHAHGSGKLYGVIDRKTDAATVQTIGRLSY